MSAEAPEHGVVILFLRSAQASMAYTSESKNMEAVVLASASADVQKLKAVRLMALDPKDHDAKELSTWQYEVAVNGKTTKETLPPKLHPQLVSWQDNPHVIRTLTDRHLAYLLNK